MVVAWHDEVIDLSRAFGLDVGPEIWTSGSLNAFFDLGLLGKSFATSVSPWVVPLAALRPWRVPGPDQKPTPAPYLQAPEPRGFDIHLELAINGQTVSAMSSAGLYWSMAQQLAHLTVNGAGVRAGDLFASGTISGPRPGTEGSLMEATGTTPRWLQDGDQVTIAGWCGDRSGPRWLSLGEVTGRVVPYGTEVSDQ